MFHTHSHLPQEIWDPHSDVPLSEPKATSFSKACFPSTCISLLCRFLHPPTILFYISNTWHFKVFLLVSTVHLNTKIERQTQCSTVSRQYEKRDCFYLSHIATKRRPPNVGKMKKKNKIHLPKMLMIQRVITEWRKATGWSHPECSGHWLRVPMNISDKRCPSGVHVETSVFYYLH